MKSEPLLKTRFRQGGRNEPRQLGEPLPQEKAIRLEDKASLPFNVPNSRHDDQVDSISQALAHKMSGFLWDQKSLDGLTRFTMGLGFPWQ